MSFKENYFPFDSVHMAIDLSKICWEVPDNIDAALKGILDIEEGKIMNPDEGRMVGHYWLRNPQICPIFEISYEIESTITEIKKFAAEIHGGGKFKNILVIGIGGSSLGPLFVSRALEDETKKLNLYFIDNTDPVGISKMLHALKPELSHTLCIVISKSGGTIETRNGMIYAQQFYKENLLDFSKYAVAVTQEGSKLYNTAKAEHWMRIFPMWDFVGGRTSVLSAVGLLPLALMGLDIDGLLSGAAEMDKLTRGQDFITNPAALLAAAWRTKLKKMPGASMVMLPYRDSLELFSKYLQQLIMESLGKELDLNGHTVHAGLTVFGNKGSSDQHSYVQQLLDGPDNFFATFVEVLSNGDTDTVMVGEDSTCGDYISAFYMGTRRAMAAKGRESITITVKDVSAFSIGALIALFERAVSIYALLVNINAYHQPAVESGKKAAAEVISLKNNILALIQGKKLNITEISEALSCSEEDAFKILATLEANGRVKSEGNLTFYKKYYV